MLALGIEIIPDALMISSFVSTKILLSIRPDALILSGENLINSSSDNAVKSNRAFNGSILADKYPLPFFPIDKSDETISRGSKFTCASVLKGRTLSREIIFVYINSFPDSLSVNL